MASRSETGQRLPPRLTRGPAGKTVPSSAADLIEWFLNYDERVARMRHPMIEELFQWKKHNGAETDDAGYPFENAEARFAVGVYQALELNDTEEMLREWISQVLAALKEARELKGQIEETNKLNDEPELSHILKADELTTNAERRLYLNSCWVESLCTAEARILGWVFQELYGRPFSEG